jgi:hypothetical protein
MKKSLLAFCISLFSFFTYGQTPANFNANDCDGTNHDLFTELNSGKIIILIWVMPCANCSGAMQTAWNVANSYSISNPGKVFLYIADDVANTSCVSLTNWVNSYSVTANRTIFSNSVINMTDYGSTGMPKMIVLGGITTHSVYYNQNGGGNINSTGIQNAVNAAISDVTGIKENSSDNYKAIVSPNPASSEITLSYEVKQAEKLSIEIYNLIGERVQTIENVSSNNKNEIKINVETLSNGTYFFKINNGKESDNVKFLISK